MPLTSPDVRAREILLEAAYSAYVDGPTATLTIPVDTRCSGCGIARPSCDRSFCVRVESAKETR